MKPVLAKLFTVLDGLEAGTTDPRVATAMSSVAPTIIKVYEVGVLEERLHALEGTHEHAG
jgi:hypothetical protein